MGLLKYGKGDWRNISRNFVISKTPTQVASHAQKYFIRQLSGGKDKRRPSIHDITTVNLTAEATTPSESSINSSSLDQFSVLPPPPQHNTAQEASKLVLDWNIPGDHGAVMVFGSTLGNLFMSSSPYDIAPNGLKLQGKNLYNGTYHAAAHTKPQQTSMFQVQT